MSIKINFLNNSNYCQFTEKESFGIIDPIPATIDEDPANVNNWILSVYNKNRYLVKFLPVDKSMIIKDANNNDISSCEGILFYPHPLHSAIIFVELKEVRAGLSGGKDQLISTIELFRANHDIAKYKCRQAYIANRKHPHFNYSRRTDCQEFLNKYNVRLFPQATISLK